MFDRVFFWYHSLVIKRARWTLSVSVVLCLLVTSNVNQFRIDVDLDRLILKTDQDWQYYKALQERFPSGSLLGAVAASWVIYTPEEDVFSDSSLAHLAKFKDELEAIEEVSQVWSILDLPLLNDPDLSIGTAGIKILTLRDGAPKPMAKEELLGNPVYKNLFLSPSSKTTALMIVPNIDPADLSVLQQHSELESRRTALGLNGVDSNRLQSLAAESGQLLENLQTTNASMIAKIRAITSQNDFEGDLIVAGAGVVVSDITGSIAKDLLVTIGGVLVLLIVVLTVIFKDLRSVLLPLSCCSVSCALMFGGLGMLQYPITLVSAAFPMMLVVITLSMIVHLLVKYHELVTSHPSLSREQLVSDTVRELFLPCFYTAITTAVAFGSLVLSDFRPVIDFGRIMVMSVFVALLTTFVLFPSILVQLKRPISKANKASSKHRVAASFAHATHRFGGAILVLMGLLLCFSVSGLLKVDVENRFVDYFRSSSEISKGLKLIDQELAGTLPIEIIVRGDEDPAASFAESLTSEADADDDCFIDDECLDDYFGEQHMLSPNNVALMKRINAYLEALPETGKVMSLITLLEVFERIMSGDLTTPQIAFFLGVIPGQLQQVLVDPFYNETTGEIRFLALVRDSEPSLKRRDFIERLRSELVHDVGLEPDEFRVTGIVVLYNNVLQSLFGSQIKTLAFVFVCIMSMFLFIFRSLSIALIGIAPNLLAAAIVIGTMGWLGVSLNIMTVTVAAITVGIAVDDTIHYLYRFRAEFEKDGRYIDAMYRAHTGIGKAMYYTSITLVLGFLVLLFAEFQPIAVFGGFTALAMVMALLLSLTVLPKLILVFKPFGPERSRSLDHSG